MSWNYYDDWRPYVPVAQRRRQAARNLAKMKKAGRQISPVDIAGRKIATTFWGDAWCRNLESYSDYSNRLPRGRSYVRNGSVIDLRIEAGHVGSLVSGSEIYDVSITIKPLAKRRWAGIKRQCAGKIGSLIELLQGSISKGVMEIVSSKAEGLFPAPREISLDCSCPDWATMCKHVAATLYAVGARLDHVPELLFSLRGVDPAEMVAAAVDQPTPGGKARRGRVLPSDELSSVFGIDIEVDEARAEQAAARSKRGRRTVRTKKKISKGSAAARKLAGRLSAAKQKAATRKTARKKKSTTTKKAAAKRAPARTTRKTGKKKTAVKKVAGKRTSTTRKSGAKTMSKKAGAKETGAAKHAPRRKTSSRSAGRTTKRARTGKM